MQKCFEVLLQEARASLKRTPELLPVLKEVGVVDSGGAGLIKILEGMQSAILGKFVEKSSESRTTEATVGADFKLAGGEDDEFGYCTEFILRLGSAGEKKPFIQKRFTNVLASHGNSLVVVRDEDIESSAHF